MDELISKATAEILFPGIKDVTSDLRNEELSSSFSGSEEDKLEPSSLTLLRESIIRSIQNRQSLITVSDKRQRQETINTDLFTARPKVEVQILKNNENSKVSNKQDSFQQPSLPVISNNLGADNCLEDFQYTAAKAENIPTATDESKSEDKRNTCKPQDNVLNGLKLACRNSSQGIYENCSTYNIIAEQLNLTNGKHSKLKNKTRRLDSSSNLNAEENATPLENQHSINSNIDSTTECINNDDYTTCSQDAQFSLSDSFFSDLANGDLSSLSGGSLSDFSDSERSNSRHMSTAKEDNNKVLARNVDQIRDEETGLSYSSKKVSKRIRKRNKKCKENKPITYRCNKCDASYIVANKKMAENARCLHCDFWTSVEPVFVKQKKQAWNTCRIC
ncbi:uncharacterized protein LOC118189405 [Stegodyphus dumicola]|uniref:uncharacterized protein LOC118189405 n=1 Tax=Stegodyphus dumicola TaxID=202533 RepID=UPI0015AE728B|nr:uncharacterized protein LOC118189405 [Stegodyphus dumicola]